MNRNGKNIEPNEPLKIIHALVSEQAKDEGLWFIAETAPEGYLQKHLRNLHALVDFLWSMEGVNNPNRQEQGGRGRRNGQLSVRLILVRAAPTTR